MVSSHGLPMEKIQGINAQRGTPANNGHESWP
jgi:hypothetical protein